jgi:hypothetical protein
VRKKLVFDSLRISTEFIDFIDGDDDWNVSSFGVIDSFDSLLFDAIISGNDEHNDVGYVSAA